MSEKLCEVFKEYDMEVFHSQRGRGAVILKTNHGVRQLKPLSETEGRLATGYQLKESLVSKGYARIDRVIINNNENMVTYDRYNNPHVLRQYYEGKECNTNDIEEIKKAVKNLALFHNCAKEIYLENEENIKIRRVSNFKNRNRELKRIKNFIIAKSPQKEFEEEYLKGFDMFYDKAVICEKEYDASEMNLMNNRCGYCHGAYDYHCVVFSKEGLATISFEKFYIGNQIEDLYHFIRKIMEKNKYSLRYYLISLKNIASGLS